MAISEWDIKESLDYRKASLKIAAPRPFYPLLMEGGSGLSRETSGTPYSPNPSVKDDSKACPF